MERQDYLNLAGVSEADWEQTPVSVKRLLVVLIERIEDQQQRLQQQHSEIEIPVQSKNKARHVVIDSRGVKIYGEGK
ncbi:MAG TPA: hypothetical protein V6D19_14990 [Stenomitos sp.]